MSAAYLDNRYLNRDESDFVNLISSDVAQYIDNVQEHSNRLFSMLFYVQNPCSVIIFPPVPNRLRFLIHKTVEDFPDVCSFSIGVEEQRRTVVCLQQLRKEVVNNSNTMINECWSSSKWEHLSIEQVDENRTTKVRCVKSTSNSSCLPIDEKNGTCEPACVENMFDGCQEQHVFVPNTRKPEKVESILKIEEVFNRCDNALITAGEIKHCDRTSSFAQSTGNKASTGQLIESQTSSTEILFTSECPQQAEENAMNSMLSGECTELLSPAMLKELEAVVGEVNIMVPWSDYGQYVLTEFDLSALEYAHMVEIYDFPLQTTTRDLLAAFKVFHDDRFDINWVDDTHAIGTFSSAALAQFAIQNFKYKDAKLRPISMACPQTKYVVKRHPELVEPYKPRPEVVGTSAKNMLARALGVRQVITKEHKAEELARLELRERKREASRRKQLAWDGKVRRCAMDME